MTTEPIQPEIEDWGYLLQQQTDQIDGLTEYSLTVVIRDTPTEAHYDPEYLEIWLFEKQTRAQRCKLGRRVYFSKKRQVRPGSVHLQDRLGKQISFYTYGGNLQCQEEADRTVYLLQSNAPILEMGEEIESFQNLLAAESEAHLAESNATWGRNDAGFDQRLAQIDPPLLLRSLLGDLLSAQRENKSIFAESPAFRQVLHQWAEEWSVADGRDELAKLLAPESSAIV